VDEWKGEGVVVVVQEETGREETEREETKDGGETEEEEEETKEKGVDPETDAGRPFRPFGRTGPGRAEAA
jgi:hypothetical protein